MKLQHASALALLLSFVACSSQNAPGSDSYESSQSALSRVSIDGTGGINDVAVDSGVKDTGTKADTGTVQGSIKSIYTSGSMLSADTTGPSSCAPQRFDLVLTDGRTCFDLAGRADGGTWLVSPTFPSAPASIRNTRCSITWLADAPTCKTPDPYSLVGCPDIISVTQRSAACAANPAACDVSTSGSLLPAVREDGTPVNCNAGPSDAGPIHLEYVGGCPSCGEIYGDQLLVTNPFNVTTVYVSVTQVSSTGVATPKTLAISAPVGASFIYNIGAGYQQHYVTVSR